MFPADCCLLSIFQEVVGSKQHKVQVIVFFVLSWLPILNHFSTSNAHTHPHTYFQAAVWSWSDKWICRVSWMQILHHHEKWCYHLFVLLFDNLILFRCSCYTTKWLLWCVMLVVCYWFSNWFAASSQNLSLAEPTNCVYTNKYLLAWEVVYEFYSLTNHLNIFLLLIKFQKYFRSTNPAAND